MTDSNYVRMFKDGEWKMIDKNRTCRDCRWHISNWKEVNIDILPCETPKETEAWSNDCFEESD